MSVLWGFLAVVVAAAGGVVLVYLESPLTVDFMYALLSGALGGLGVGLVSLAGGGRAPRTALYMFVSILGAAVFWLFGWALLGLASVNLFSHAALAFDLIIGMVGAVSASMVVLDYSEKAQAAASENAQKYSE